MPELDRERVEELLPWHLRAALPDILAVWGVRIPERWPSHHIIRDFLTLTAVQVLQARGERRGMSRTGALSAACSRSRS